MRKGLFRLLRQKDPGLVAALDAGETEADEAGEEGDGEGTGEGRWKREEGRWKILFFIGIFVYLLASCYQYLY